jgi:hypothetical protein
MAAQPVAAAPANADVKNLGQNMGIQYNPPNPPTADEKKRLVESIKTQMYYFEMNILPFIELWSQQQYFREPQMALLEQKMKTYKMLSMMLRNNEDKHCSCNSKQ